MIKILILVVLLFLTTLSAKNGWYLGNTCESIKRFQMKSPLDLISEWGCKPYTTNNTEVSADMGLLSFDCRNTDLNGYMNLIFGKERCILVKNTTEKRIKK